MINYKVLKGFEDIRKALSAQIKPFDASVEQDPAKRRARALADLRYFAETYFPHYLTLPPSQMHEDFFRDFQLDILSAQETGEGSSRACAAPRGNAKSTIATLILPLWCIVGKRRQFIAIVSDTTEQSEEFVEFIKAEIEINERLQEDFPNACGKGGRWKIGHIITSNGVKVRAYGSEKKLRGTRSGARRPDLVIGDDLENDEAVQSAERRRKFWGWFTKALMPIGAKYTVTIIVGTLLHYDSLLAQLLGRTGWRGKKYKAVIQFSQSPLWQRWEAIASDKSRRDPEAEAGKFFTEHRDEMLEGTEVLWPDGESYLDLMKMRLRDGPSAFDSEKQNEPINPEDCLFQEQWFTFWDDSEGSAIRKGDELFCAVDPSMGKKSAGSDPSAIIVAARRESGYVDVLEAEIAKRHPDAIMERLFDLHQQYRFERVAIEEVQFQELFKDQVLREGMRRGVYLPIEGVRPTTDKTLRITKLQPQIKNGVIRFRRNQTDLLAQLKFFPKAAHDDGPDALDMAWSVAVGNSQGPRLRAIA